MPDATTISAQRTNHRAELKAVRRETYLRPPADGKRVLLLGCMALLAAYANHLQNGFHFDDAHAVVNNVFIRDLANISRFFTDGRTFSSLPTNQSWRPPVSTSLALDGLKPLWFHISTFFCFLVF